MTPPAQPHPQRCDTCGHHILQPLMKYPHCCDHPIFHNIDEDGMMLIGMDEYLRIGVMGCASHTSASQHRIGIGDYVDLINSFEGELSDGYDYYGGQESVLKLAKAIALLQAGDP